jgi:hypothetical protein
MEIRSRPSCGWRTVMGMTRADTIPGGGRHGTDPTGEGRPTHEAGVPVVITVVEAPACHLCEDAKSALAVLAVSYPMTINVVSMTEQPGRSLMQTHRAPMSPLVLLDGAYFSSGRLPRRKLEKRLAKAQGGVSNGQ